MCLAVPGRIIERCGDDGVVDFQGSRVKVNLTLTPEAELNDWVLVHAGFGISKLDEAEAMETWNYLNAMNVEIEGSPAGPELA